MGCLSCGAATLVNENRALSYTYKNESTLIPAVTGDYCPACGDAVLDANQSDRVSAAMLDFNQQVDRTN